MTRDRRYRESLRDDPRWPPAGDGTLPNGYAVAPEHAVPADDGGQPGPYPPQDPYASLDPYANRDPYAPRDPYATTRDPYPQEPYDARDSYPDPVPRQSQDPYAEPDPYGRQAPRAGSGPHTAPGRYGAAGLAGPRDGLRPDDPYLAGDPDRVAERYGALAEQQGRPAAYHPQDPYRGADPLDPSVPYVPLEPYDQPRSLAPADSYGQRGAQGETDPYGQTDPLGGRDAYGAADPGGHAAGGRAFPGDSRDPYRGGSVPGRGGDPYGPADRYGPAEPYGLAEGQYQQPPDFGPRPPGASSHPGRGAAAPDPATDRDTGSSGGPFRWSPSDDLSGPAPDPAAAGPAGYGAGSGSYPAIWQPPVDNGSLPGYGAGSDPRYPAGGDPRYPAAGGDPDYLTGGGPAYPAGGDPRFPAGTDPAYLAGGPGGDPGYLAGGGPAYPAGGDPRYPAGGDPDYLTGGDPAYPAGDPRYPASGNPAYLAGSDQAYPAGGDPWHPEAGGPPYPAGGAPSYLSAGDQDYPPGEPGFPADPGSRRQPAGEPSAIQDARPNRGRAAGSGPGARGVPGTGARGDAGPAGRRGPARAGTRGPGSGPGGKPAGGPRDPAPAPGKRLKKRRRSGTIAGLAAAIVIVLVLGAAGLYGYKYVQAKLHPANFTGNGHGVVQVQVLVGDTAISLAPRLKRLGVIASTGAFISAVKASGNPNALEPGTFRLHKQMNAALAWKLLLTPSARIQATVTIPEGLRQSQIIATLGKETKFKPDAYAQALKDPKALGLPSFANGKAEGYLFPATYQIPPGMTALQILQGMVNRFHQEAQIIDLPAAAKTAKVTESHIIIVASLVQAEGGTAADFPKIARVIYNRLNSGRKLELDSTVFYALGKYGIQASTKDLSTPSRYNTYLHAGLPPGPIDSPGDAAIKAALHPAHGNWLFFVTVDPKKHITKFTASETQFEKFRAELARNIKQGR